MTMHELSLHFTKKEQTLHITLCHSVSPPPLSLSISLCVHDKLKQNKTNTACGLLTHCSNKVQLSPLCWASIYDSYCWCQECDGCTHKYMSSQHLISPCHSYLVASVCETEREREVCYLLHAMVHASYLSKTHTHTHKHFHYSRLKSPVGCVRL